MSPLATICCQCGTITATATRGRCPDCAKQRNTADNKRRNAKPQHRIWNDQRWHRCRTKVVIRDGYRCVDCHRHKDQLKPNERLLADHIDGLRTIIARGDSPFDTDLCATRCSTCSGRKDGGMR